MTLGEAAQRYRKAQDRADMDWLRSMAQQIRTEADGAKRKGLFSIP